MKIVIPVSKGDIQLLEPNVSVMEYWKGIDEFDVLLSPSTTVMAQCEPFIDRLRLIARSADIINPAYTEFGAWPHGPNRHWVQTVYALDNATRQGEAGDCWFWKELDCWEIAPNAYRKLSDGYARAASVAKAAGKNNYFYGKVVNKPSRDEAGRITFEKFANGEFDTMMMGCAVYCSGMSKNPFWRAQANGLRDWNGAIPGYGQPNGWDVELRTFFKNSGWTHTDLIGDRWNTLNYRFEDGVLKCDAGPTPFKNRAHNETDISGAAIIHGAKDDSLAKLILDGKFGTALAVQVQGWSQPVQATQTAPVPLVETPTQNLRISNLESKIDSIESTLQQMVGLLSAKVSAAPNAAVGEPQRVVQSSSTHETKGSAEPILEKVGEHVFGKKCMRLSELSKKLKIQASELETVIEESKEFILQRPLKWVKRRAA